MMKKFVKYGTSVVVAHTAVVSLHALSHEALLIALSQFQSLFVGLMIVIAPILAASLLWTRFSRIGAGWLLGSMVCALAFGLYNHFILISPDHVSQIPMSGWGILFQLTAVLLAIIEGVGVGVSLWMLNDIRPQTTLQ